MAAPQQWRTGLFSCFDDIGVCCQGCLCAPKLFGKNANRIDGSNQCLMCMAYSFMPPCSACFLHLPRRRAIRAAFNLEEHPNDILVICCCDSCAHCQEKREMDLRGVPDMPAAIIRQPR